MYKSRLCLFFICCSSYLFSAIDAPPHVVDYGKFKAALSNYGHMEKESWKYGYFAFNYSPELIPFFASLKKEYQIEVAVETGTFIGGTTVALSLLFDQVHTIELNEKTFLTSYKDLQPFTNVKCYLGSSDTVLNQLLPTLQGQRVLFYLDAHGAENWPLLQEIKEIGTTHRDNCIIVIDDFKVPGRPEIPFDWYGTDECSYEYVKDQLDQAFSEYTHHYLIPKDIGCRAKLIVIPKTWQ